MNPGDIAVVVILLVSALLAFARGFVREVLSIAAWIGAAFVTLYAFPYARPFLRQYITVELLADIATGVGIFVVALIVFSTLSHYIAKGVQGTTLNAVDRSLGFLFGLARGALLVCLGYLMLLWLFPPPNQPVWVQQARFLPWVERGAEALRTMVPQEVLERSLGRANAARQRIEQDAQTVDRLRQLSVPLPNSNAPQDQPGYNQEQRDAIQPLFENAH